MLSRDLCDFFLKMLVSGSFFAALRPQSHFFLSRFYLESLSAAIAVAQMATI